METVKTIKDTLRLDLKQAVELVDGIPSIIQQGLTKREAEELATKLKKAGVDVEIK